VNRMRKPRHREIDLSGLKTYPISRLDRKVNREAFAHPTSAGVSFADWVQSLPDILAAGELRTLAETVARAAADGGAVIAMFGGHIIKTGLAPLLIDWMERGVVTALATHGAGVIHDVEIALFGRTSEDVAEGLADGSFGMCRDTADFINRAVADPRNRELGFGEAVGAALAEAEAPHSGLSVLCAAPSAEGC